MLNRGDHGSMKYGMCVCACVVEVGVYLYDCMFQETSHLRKSLSQKGIDLPDKTIGFILEY